MIVAMLHAPNVPGALARFPGFLLSKLGERTRVGFTAALEPLGLHPKHFGVMTVLDKSPGITQQELSALVAVDPSTMVAIIDDLERKGLAERRPHAEDRRARCIHLTRTGRGKLVSARAVAAKHQEELLAPLSEEERATLLRLLQKLAGVDLAAGHVDPPRCD
jgi:DNA-binding MarR family transcriptional regulator